MNQWAVGMVLSVVLGGIATSTFLHVLRWTIGRVKKPRRPDGWKSVPAWLTGVVERVFFTVLVGLEVEGVPAAMVAWIAVKMLTNWNQPDWKDNPAARSFAFSALLGGLVSMLFAVIGGLVCAGKLRVAINT